MLLAYCVLVDLLADGSIPAAQLKTSVAVSTKKVGQRVVALGGNVRIGV